MASFRSQIRRVECVEEGFLGDENDCQKFYRCVGDGKGKFMKYEFTCSSGTVWDPEINGCNHPWASKNEKCRQVGQTNQEGSSGPSEGVNGQNNNNGEEINPGENNNYGGPTNPNGQYGQDNNYGGQYGQDNSYGGGMNTGGQYGQDNNYGGSYGQDNNYGGGMNPGDNYYGGATNPDNQDNNGGGEISPDPGRTIFSTIF